MIEKRRQRDLMDSESDESLSERLERLVVQAVLNGLVVYDAEGGLAVTNKMPGRVRVAVARFEEWWASDQSMTRRGGGEARAWRSAYWEALGRYPAEQTFRLLCQYQEWIGSESYRCADSQQSLAWNTAYNQASRRRRDEQRRVEDLDVALQLGSAQEAALGQLGVELQDLGVLMWTLSYGLAADLSLARGGKVSPPVAKRVCPLLENRIRSNTGIRAASAPVWFLALVTQVAAGAWLHAWGNDTPAETLLGVLKASVSQLPPRMATPSPADVDRADQFLSTCRVNSIKPEFLPRGGRGGPPKTPWTAARDFAECFGITGIPPERDARR